MFTIKEILNATCGILINQNQNVADNNIQCCGVSIDSRKIKPNEIFFAVAGDNFNGHDYIQKAIEAKAAVVIAETAWAKEHAEDLNKIDTPIIAVENTVSALAALARTHRKKFSIPVIAVTGSNGKTTTKDMIACVLSAEYKVLKSKASFNNHIGVPLTLLELDSTHQAAVIEMGMNHKGEIRGLASIACPDIGIITNAANAHIEFFESISDIIEAKCELFEYLGPNSIALINADCKKLYARACDFGIDLITFGIKNHCTYQAANIVTHAEGITFTVNEKYTFKLNLLGEHNVYNALAAIAVGLHFKINYSLIRAQLLKFSAVSLRMQTIKFQGTDIIADCYNANPASTQAAINALISIKSKKRKIFVFADMLELGKFSKKAHQQIGEIIAESSISKLITVGEKAQFTASSAKDCGMSSEDIYKCETNQQAAAILKEIIDADDAVVLKGSRGMHLEEIIEFLNNN